MEADLVRLVLVRMMIEHRFGHEANSWAQVLSLIAIRAGVSQRYVRNILAGDVSNPDALDRIEDAITSMSDARGGVPSHCCGQDVANIIGQELAKNRLETE